MVDQVHLSSKQNKLQSKCWKVYSCSVHIVESVGYCGLRMRWCLACISYAHVMHFALCAHFFMMLVQLEMLLIPNALCWSSQKCNCACALPAEVQLRLRVTRRNWKKLFAGKNFLTILVTVQTQLRSYSEQQRAFGNSNICNCKLLFLPLSSTLHRWYKQEYMDINTIMINTCNST